MVHQVAFLKNCVHFLFFESYVHVKHLKVVMSWHLLPCARLRRGCAFVPLLTTRARQQRQRQEQRRQDQATEAPAPAAVKTA